MLSPPRPDAAGKAASSDAPPHVAPAGAAQPPAPPTNRVRRWSAALGTDLVAAAPAWLVARVVVLATLIGARGLTSRLAAVPEPIRRHVEQGLLGWDAERYLQLASSGYASLPRTELRFFPLLPALVRLLDPVLPGGRGTALLLIANLAALAFGMVLHRVALVETRDEALARRAAWFAAIFPSGFVFAWGYTESLWCALSAGSLLAARRRRWAVAAALAAAAALLRPVGVLLALPLAIEAWRGRPGAGGTGGGRWSATVGALAAAAAPIAGAGAYLAWVGRSFGDPLLPLAIQQSPAFRGETTDPVSSIWGPLTALLRGELTIESSRVLWLVVLVGLVVVLARRWPASYTAFAGLLLLVALSTTRLGSFERYTFTAFPVLLALATISARPSVERVLLAACGSLLGVYGLLALLGAYVP